jgi:heterodisulfide reductase subunit C
MTEIETIKKLVREMLASHELEALVVVRDRKTKEVLYETGHTNVGLEDQISFRHIIGDVEVVEV